ncbi:unnamed protein product [Adineta ricciae]|uniref:Sushi domain-containing protein n=1 Tax=Adineta ricciae TaxID=249248 RepID=A0A814C9H8_ADIRI|nr:unnamed protein product [Adineta ricciae]CAF1289993.1 unnamed protein product [Adineta ricciae]
MLLQFFVCTYIFSICLADIDESLLYCKSSPPKLTNGIIKRDRVSYYTGKGYLGSMEYMCLSGYNLLGNKIVTCQNGIWSKMTQCIPKRRCPPIQTYPRNTIVVSDNITYFQNDPQQIIAGSTVTIRCQDKYELDPASEGSLTIQCQNEGSWTPMPSCRHVQGLCNYSKLYLPAGSRIIRMDLKFSEHDRQLHAVGSSLEYACDEGYRLHGDQTSLIVQCLESGSWSALPVCEFVYQAEQPVRCSYPIYIKNGYMAVYNVTIWEDQTYTGRIVYECNYGFETLDEKDQIISECINGSWTNVTDCQEMPTCQKQDLLTIESQAENSYVYNVSLQYIRDPQAFVYNSYVLRECLPNFEHNPSSPSLTIRCQRSTNTWTGTPICRAIDTVAEESSESSDNLVLLTENATETSIQAETMSNTIVFSTVHAITCDSNDIPLLTNADLVQSPLNVTYEVDTKLTYRCQSGYESLLNQSSYTICLINGTWSLDAINASMCQLRQLPEEVPVDTSTTIMSDTTAEYNNTLDGNENVTIINDSNATMTSSTQSKGASDRRVRHILSQCKQLPQIENALLLSDDTIKSNSNNETTYSGSLLYVCQLGFMSDTNEHEPFRLTCQNGVFHPKTICIEKPRCSLPLPIDISRLSIINSMINVFDASTNEAIPGSYVLLNCVNKINNENSIFNMTCMENGQWSALPVSCIAPFKRRCSSGITIPNARTRINAKLTTDGYYDDGSRATYQCLDNFVHDRQSGPLHIQCRNGRWGPRPRCIPSGCLEPMPDMIENGWKSAESFVVHNNVKYYTLARYSCNKNAVLVDSSLSIIDIGCQNREWKNTTLPACQLRGEERKK